MQILALLLSLSLLIFLHELGHFFFARLFKTRVEKFYLFFNPYFSLVRAKRVNKKWKFSWFSRKAPEEWSEDADSTEWGLGWIPLGGYCAIAGMIDETKTADDLPSEPQPWEYRSKKAWQRLLIISGGVIMNFVLAVCIYVGMLFVWGQESLPLKNATLGYDYHDILREAGFQNGDIPVKADGKEIASISDFVEEILYESADIITVDRNGQEKDILVPKGIGQDLLAANAVQLTAVRFPFVAEAVQDNMPAKAAGVQVGDSIVGINDSVITTFQDFFRTVNVLKNEKIVLNIIRNNEPLSIEVQTTEDGYVGIVPYQVYTRFFTTEKKTYGFFESIPAGISLGVNTLGSYVKQFKLVFTKEGAKQLGGFITIGSIFPKTWNWFLFWNMTAFLSIILAFMNILPIPGLDGGHVMFTLYEMITGKKPSDKFLERAQMVGMIILFALLIFANGNDIIRLFSR